ncbi:hypothetical protein ABZ924_35445 [Streptomyces sp. NPDC046876]|uniref:hypothetical protein n=1 Tax=Streptomyces sp. NPDC046876 TaxID=3155616 RepID=UPI0033F56108
MPQTGHERPGRPVQERPVPHAPGRDRPQEVPRPADPRELLTDGVVELRKRGELAACTADADTDDPLATMARRTAERAAQRVAAKSRTRA